MIIVQGTGRVDSELRERFLAQRVESMQVSRAEPGNLEYVFAADPIEADRVILSERWETQEILRLTSALPPSGGVTPRRMKVLRCQQTSISPFMRSARPSL